jgi:hypothetical protein
MQKALVALVPILALLGCSGLDLDGAETTSGEIDSMDEGDRLVTIDGVRYEIDEDVSISNLDEGDKVTVTFEEGDPYYVITDIAAHED